MSQSLRSQINPARRRFLKSGACLAALAAAQPALAARVRWAPDPFIEALIGKMTVEEKAGQLTMSGAQGMGRLVNPQTGPEPALQVVLEDIRKGRLTGLFNGDDVRLGRTMQTIAVEKSRLGIPLVFAADIIHGLKTAFPVPLGEAASFDADLCARTARATALEATAFGLHWTFAPSVDVARDQRWGRVVEAAGEDPWLGAHIAQARVKGFQGEDLRRPDVLLACPKHFAGYGAVQAGLDYASADIPETTLRETHLPPFRAAFAAGALSTMASFNDVAGVPSTGNHHLLTDILRGEWDFKGVVVTDFGSEKELVAHGFAVDEADAVLKAITAGCDLSIHGGLYLKHIPGLVQGGRLSMRVLDEAVRRVLRVKKALGLFENPYRSLDPERLTTDIRKPDSVALARESARKSLVLLKNDNGLLPLPKTGTSIALLGPFVTDRSNALGPWMVFPDFKSAVTLEEGFRAALDASASLSVVQGCGVEKAIPGGIEAAVAAAKASDVAVLYIGETAIMSGEGASRVDLSIPRAQQDLVEAIAALGKPMVVLLKHGRALELSGAVANAQAIMCTWFLGSESGNAIADVVFGDHAPQGRLPISFPQRSGQQPFFYNHRSSGRPEGSGPAGSRTRYREVSNRALYPFGHGLGYSNVSYGSTELSAPRLSKRGSVKVRAQITNQGARAQREVAQLYVHARAANPVQPVRVLKNIRLLDLAPGESAIVEFEVTSTDLAFIHQDLVNKADSGVYDVWIAPSAYAGAGASLELEAGA
ncbi:glycoside hydrolase family 3 N-terminal domain-containing protein [Caulobacter sp. Root343]|uniref:glycoside hydrolase family 3 N-terminal domain-containing protein n=1 Tax=Caulobacter sp. Root343 TaxID=1736520 RepID=UPI001F3D676A|nr:glycoside hydrolase family 3 N-terminal domain-containing protein [Caulobacter sp. Root343]